MRHANDILDNPKSERVKRIRSYYIKKNRQRFERTVVEGVNAVEALVKRFAGNIIELLIVDKIPQTVWGGRIESIKTLASEQNVLIRYATDDVLNAISDNHEGVLAVAKTSQVTGFEDDNALVVICKDTSDPGNAGAIVRAAAALGVSKVIFAGDAVDHWNPKVLRASAGAAFSVSILNIVSALEATKFMHNCGYTVIALDGYGTPQNPARDLQVVFATLKGDAEKSDHKPMALLFGNEAHGLTDEDLELADHIARIEMHGSGVESLNLAGAVHIVLYEYQRKFR